MKRIFAVLALIVLSISPVLADAGLIAPGHVLGNPDNYARTPTDTSILSVIQAAGYYAPVPLATGGADNATAINAAITAAAAQGGGTVQLACGGSASNPFWFSQIVMVSNVYLKGCGKDATFLKQIANSNKGAIIGPSNFSSLVGTGLPNGGSTLTGLQFVGVSDLTVDGNISNNTSGDCLDIYGRYLVVEHIRLTNCANKGMWSEWGLGYSGPPTNPTTFDNGLEGFYSDIHIWNVGQEGLHANGPHDSYWNGVWVAGASASSNNTYTGVYIGQNGGSNFFNLHYYATNLGSSGAIVAKCGLDVEGPGGKFIGSDFEGAYLPVHLGNGLDCYGNNTTGYFGGAVFDGSVFYNTIGSAEIEIHSSLNVISGGYSPGGFGSAAYTLVKLGTGLSSDNPTNNQIEINTINNNSGAIDFTGEGAYGGNRIKITGVQFTGPGYIGTPNSTDTVYVDILNATSNSVINQEPAPFSSLYVGGSYYGKANAGINCTTSTTCYIYSSNTDGVSTDPSTINVSANGAGTVSQIVNGNGTLVGLVNTSNYVYIFNQTLAGFKIPVGLEVYTISTLPTCSTSIGGGIAYVSDTVAGSVSWHGVVVGGGSTTVHGLVSCNGSGWQYE